MSRIVIDPGHGGSARAGSSTAHGACGAAGTLEKDVTLDIARHVVARLGASAALTRAGDANLSLGQRAACASRGDAAVFVSIHANSGPPEMNGAETWVHTDASSGSRDLAASIQRSVDRMSGRDRYRGAHDRAFAGPLAVLSPAVVGRGTDACLVEVDYLSSPIGEQRLRDPNQRAAIGAAIADAIVEHTARRFGTAACAPTTVVGANASLSPDWFRVPLRDWSLQELFNGLDSRALSTSTTILNERQAILEEIRQHRRFVVSIHVNRLTDVGSAANPAEDEIIVRVENGCAEKKSGPPPTTVRVGYDYAFRFDFADFPQHELPLRIHIVERDRSGSGGPPTWDELDVLEWNPRWGESDCPLAGGAYSVHVTGERY